ncbi:MAG: hypothetical protein LUD18_04605 [Lachnospiraceae bacterium]|nr:hypothetical protein [Lachnospiraceae bacterium]
MRCSICGTRIQNPHASVPLFPKDDSPVICLECNIQRRYLILGNHDRQRVAKDYFETCVSSKGQEPEVLQYVTDLIRYNTADLPEPAKQKKKEPKAYPGKEAATETGHKRLVLAG